MSMFYSAHYDLTLSFNMLCSIHLLRFTKSPLFMIAFDTPYCERRLNVLTQIRSTLLLAEETPYQLETNSPSGSC